MLHNKSFSRFILLISMAFLLVLMTACGSSGNSSTEGGQTNQGQQSGTGSEAGGSAAEGEKRVFKIAHTSSESHVWSKTMEKFKEELEARSNGRLSLDIYLNSVLGNNADMMQQMQAGVLDMAFIPAAELTNRSTTFNAWFMPFLLTDLNHVYEMSKTEEAQAVLKSLDENTEGVHPLGYIHVGMRHVLMKDDAIVNPDDFKNMKIRVSNSPVIVDFWKKMGAEPTSMPLSEVYTAFQTGVVDGIDIDMLALTSQKFYEVGKQLTLTNHMTYQGVAYFSKAIWDELPDGDKKLIEEAFAAAQEFNAQTSVADEEAYLQQFKAQGGVVNEIADDTAFRKVTADFIAQYRSSDPLIDAFVKKAEELAAQ